MFDITWFIREKIFRNKKIKQDNIAAEDLSEKQTTKLWYLLLFLMFITIIVSAQWTINIIKNVVNRPNDIPYCVKKVLNVLEDGKYYSSPYYNDEFSHCNLTSDYPKFNFTYEINNLKPIYKTVLQYNKEVNNLNYKKRSLSYSNEKNRKTYETSLLEKMANEENTIYKREIIKQDIRSNNKEINQIISKINNINKKINSLLEQNKDSVLVLNNKIEKVHKEYKTAYLWYKFKLAVLLLLFIGSVFTILYKLYVKTKSKNSPYTIIFSVATFTYGLVFLQIVFSIFYDLIPHRFILFLEKLLNNFKPLLYILQFIYPIIIVWIFGFIIYKIQKRLYSKENILKRIIQDKKCPNCWNTVDINKKYCPLCDYQIQERCANCKQLTIKWMPYCSNCWNKLNDNK